MFTHDTTATRPRLRRTILASAFIAAFVSPLAIAPAAQAVKSAGSCTVTAIPPKFSHHNDSGKKVFDYKADISCSKGGRHVYTYIEGWELDTGWFGSDDEYFGKCNHKWVYFAKAGSRTYHCYLVLGNTEDGNEEIYTRARIHEWVDKDFNKWSSWDYSKHTNAPN